MASTTYLTRTPSSASNRKTFTFSAWVKPSSTTSGVLFSCGTDISNGPLFTINFRSDTNIRVEDTISGGTQPINLRTSRLFRDHNAWYHLVVAVDTTQGTASDRVKIYVNGEQETSFTSATYPGQHIDTSVNNNHIHAIGARSTSQSGTYYNGSMSHVHFCDGTALAPTVFGSTDSTTGEWKINASPSFTPGTNGFTILKDGNTITDQSANSNNWSLSGGTLTKTEDNPSNVFATNNVLWKQESTRYLTHTRGNTMMSGGGSATWYQTPATLAFNSGKFYWECKYNAGTNLTQNNSGVIDYEKTQESGQFRSKTGSVFFTNEDGGEVHIDGPATSADYGTIGQNDILGVAVDMDATTPTVKFYKNGSLLVSVNASSLAGKFVTPAHMIYQSGEFQVNYGNGAFSSTQLTGTTYQGNGNLGIFKYQPPTGYTALSTKGLNL